jgi:hypothetical protein
MPLFWILFVFGFIQWCSYEYIRHTLFDKFYKHFGFKLFYKQAFGFYVSLQTNMQYNHSGHKIHVKS